MIDRINNIYFQGTGLKHLQKKGFKNIKLKIPSETYIQDKIADILSLVDNNIEQTKKVIEKAEKLKKYMMQNLLTGRMKPDGTYRNKDEIEEVEVEKVPMKPLQKFLKFKKPKSWEFTSLTNIIEFIYGSALGEDNVVKGNYPVYGSNGINSWHNEFLVKAPGIIVGRKGTVGSITWADKDFFPIDTTYYVKTKENLNLRWVHYILDLCDLVRLNAATGVPGLNRKDALSMYVFKPSRNEQDEIVNLIENFHNKIDTNKQKLKTLEKLKKSLMQNLLTGKIEIPEILTIKRGVVI